MYSLVEDETECKSILGTIIYTQRKVYGFSAKVTDVVLPDSRFFGHVDYKLEIKATPHNSIDNEPRTFDLTTRFKEISRLHSTLATIHRQLYLKDKFPSFVEPKLFGITDPETINERRDSIECFLQFVLNNETLCKSKAFQKFIEAAKEESHLKKIISENSPDTGNLEQFLRAQNSEIIEHGNDALTENLMDHFLVDDAEKPEKTAELPSKNNI